MRLQFFIYFILFCWHLVGHEQLHAQVVDSLPSDSVDVMVVHYKVVDNGELFGSMINYLVFLTEDRIILHEEYERENGLSTSRRVFMPERNFTLETHDNDFDNTKNYTISPLRRAELFPDSLLNILGYNCSLANYNYEGYQCKAYYTDMFGITFSTAAIYPGIALYYEKASYSGKYGFLADWIQPMKVLRSDVYHPAEEALIKKGEPANRQRIVHSTRIPLSRNYQPAPFGRHSMRSTAPISSRTVYRSNPQVYLKYKTIDGKKHSAADSKDKVVVIQLLNSLQNDDSQFQQFSNLASEYSTEDVLFVCISFEKVKQYKPQKNHLDTNVQIVFNAKKVLQQNGINQKSGYLVINRLGHEQLACELNRERLQSKLKSEIEFALAESYSPQRLAK